MVLESILINSSEVRFLYRIVGVFGTVRDIRELNKITFDSIRERTTVILGFDCCF